MPDSTDHAQLGQSLHRFTGGNPMFVLETVRALREQGSLETLTPERFENRRRALGLTQSPKVGAVITRRLERLSARALDLSRVAAVMGEHFRLELGAKVLNTTTLELSRVCEELEVAQLWQGFSFVTTWFLKPCSREYQKPHERFCTVRYWMRSRVRAWLRQCWQIMR